MAEPLRVRDGLEVPGEELRWRFSRSSGPGGQHVNTSDTRAELRWDLAGSEAWPEPVKQRAIRRLAGRLTGGELVVRSAEHRSQWRNRAAAAQRMAELLAVATGPEPRARRATRPSRRVVERRLADKRHRSQLKRSRRGGD